jgi:hypothetical protein
VCVCVCVCVCAQGPYFEGDQVSIVICPTITVLYHVSGNFLTSPHTSLLQRYEKRLICEICPQTHKCL